MNPVRLLVWLRVLPQGLVATGTVRVVGVLVSFAAVVTLARLLGPDGYGRYVYVLSVLNALTFPVQSGLSTLVVRETARAAQAHDWSLLAGLWRWTSRVIACYAAFTAVVIAGALWFWHDSVSDTTLILIIVGLPFVFCTPWAASRAAALSGLRRVALSRIVDDVLRPGLPIGIFVPIYFLLPTDQSAVWIAMATTSLASLLILLATTVLLQWLAPTEVIKAPKTYCSSMWLKSLGPLALLGGMQLIMRYTDIVTLGFFVSSSDVGIYRTASQCALPIGFALQTINMVVGPNVARLHAAKDRRELQALVTWSARLAMAIALPAAIVLILAGGAVLTLFFGPSYAAGHWALAIIAVGQLANVAAGPVGLVLNMSGHERDAMYGIAVGAGVNAGLNLALIPWIGIVGAAIATTVGLVTWNLLLWRTARGRAKVDCTALALSV